MTIDDKGNDYLPHLFGNAGYVVIRRPSDLPKRLPLGWQGLVDISGSRAQFDELYEETNEKTVCRFLINDARSSGSLLNSLEYARENTRTLRGIIPREAVEYVNELSMYAKDMLSEPLSRTRTCQVLNRTARTRAMWRMMKYPSSGCRSHQSLK